jgi:5-formyltetrahydrofolate cyclo-ligase
VNSGQLKRAKRRVRGEVLARRDALDPAERARLGVLVAERVRALPEIGAARVVMAFWSFGSELPTRPLIERFVADGIVVALPRIEGAELAPRAWRPGEPTTPTSFGAREPAGGAAIAPTDVDVVVTPAVAFDRAGRRVGYGGGFYDRFLPTTRAGTLWLGAGFGLQLVEEDLPAGAFDLRVHAIVTEAETVQCPRE